MIYFSADDYGLNDISSKHILQCAEKGGLNKISVFPNIEKIDLEKIPGNVKVSLHLNLVEGKCMANAEEIGLLADENGDFINEFGGLFKLSLLHKKKFKEQVYKEIKAQVLYWKGLLPENSEFCIDSHQHTHMIPAVFEALLEVLSEEGIEVEYMRIPSEPILPYLKTPSLYYTYSIINLIKQWLLKVLWVINKPTLKNRNIPTAYFFGILFSGKMDEKRVNKVLPKYIDLAKKSNSDIEVLFHPGYLDEREIDFKNKNIVFRDFYLSQNRKTEFDSVINISERSVS